MKETLLFNLRVPSVSVVVSVTFARSTELQAKKKNRNWERVRVHRGVGVGAAVFSWVHVWASVWVCGCVGAWGRERVGVLLRVFLLTLDVLKLFCSYFPFINNTRHNTNYIFHCTQPRSGPAATARRLLGFFFDDFFGSHMDTNIDVKG